MQTSYGDGSRAALVVAETTVANAEKEVDTAIEGIHGVRTTTIEQTAERVHISATEETVEAKYQAALDVTARAIQSMVSSAGGSSTYTQTDDGFNFTITSNMTAVQDSTARNSASSAQSTANSAQSTANTANSNASTALSTANSAQSDVNAVKAYMSFTNNSGTGTLTLGGSSTAINMGGSSTTINMGGTYSSINIGAARISQYSTGGLSISPRGGSSNVGLYVTSSGMMVGNSSAMNDGNVDCGSVTCTGTIETSKVESNGSYMYTNVGPLVSGGASCGSNTYKWSKVYAESGTIQTSSIHTKENIEPVSDEKASRLLDVNVVKFDYTLDHWKREKGRKGWYGVIAEEVHDLFPEVVLDWDTGTEIDERTGEEVKVYPGVTYEGFIPHLIKLCQMQQVQIDALTARIDALEGENHV